MNNTETAFTAIQSFRSSLKSVPLPEGTEWLKRRDKGTVPALLSALKRRGLELYLVDHSVPHETAGMPETYDRIQIAGAGKQGAIISLCTDLNDAARWNMSPLGVDAYRVLWQPSMRMVSFADTDVSSLMLPIIKYELFPHGPLWKRILFPPSVIELTTMTREQYNGAHKL